MLATYEGELDNFEHRLRRATNTPPRDFVHRPSAPPPCCGCALEPTTDETNRKMAFWTHPWTMTSPYTTSILTMDSPSLDTMIKTVDTAASQSLHTHQKTSPPPPPHTQKEKKRKVKIRLGQTKPIKPPLLEYRACAAENMHKIGWERHLILPNF